MKILSKTRTIYFYFVGVVIQSMIQHHAQTLYLSITITFKDILQR